MPFTIQDYGQNNHVDVSPEAMAVGPVQIVLAGRGNRLGIGAGARISGHIELREEEGTIDIGAECVITGQLRLRAPGTHLRIGAQTTILGASITLHESGRIRLGRDCMLSGGILMDVSDMHSIVDRHSGRRLNPPEDIEIGDHVWLGQGVQVLKGSRIGAHSVIGARSLVRGTLPAYCLAAGLPARVLREGVSWDRRRLPWNDDSSQMALDFRNVGATPEMAEP